MAHVAGKAAQKRLSGRVWRLVTRPSVTRFLTSPHIQGLLRRSEGLIPLEVQIRDWLKAQRPDAVVASPYIFPGAHEVEYVKAAKALGIPTVVAVLSWDNMSTKGTFHVYPDHVLVWNDSQAREASLLHDVPPPALFATGAPVYDPWFQLKPTISRAEFCHKVGLNPDQPYLAYLSSAFGPDKDEPQVVRRIAATLAERPQTEGMNILVRPHPFHAAIWDSLATDKIKVWPPGGSRPDDDQSRQDYYHTLHYSLAVVALITSGFLDAAAVDKPCLTIMAEPFRSEQIKRRHFNYLVEGGFIEMHDDYSAVVEAVGQILAGADPKAAQRRKFVQDFLRPWGLDRPAAEIMARAIEAAARREPVTPEALGLI
jgi:hypothetical protein